MCIASLMHRSNSFQHLGRYSDDSIRIEPLSEVMRLVYNCVDSGAKKFEHETLMISIRTFMDETIE